MKINIDKRIQLRDNARQILNRTSTKNKFYMKRTFKEVCAQLSINEALLDMLLEKCPEYRYEIKKSIRDSRLLRDVLPHMVDIMEAAKKSATERYCGARNQQQM